MKKKLIHILSVLTIALFRCLPVRKRVFVYTIRSDGALLENLDAVVQNLGVETVIFAKMLPHTRFDALRVRYLLLPSRVILTDDYLKYLRDVQLKKKQRVIQIWHAVGAFKRFGLDAPSNLSREDEINTHAQYTDVCVSSNFVRLFYASAFGVDLDVVKALGVPRTDALLDRARLNELRAALLDEHPQLKGKTVYLYLPTFRETDGVVTDFDPQLDFFALNAALKANERLVIRRHPVMKTPFFPEETYERIVDLTDVSATALLSAANVVVTDYSSVLFDAALLGLPLVFYAPDFDTYERDFYLDYETDLPGEIVRDPSVLLPALRQAKKRMDKEKLAAFCQKEAGACDGQSTARVVRLVTEALQRR